MEKMKKLLDTDPVTELDCFIGISARARRERERKAREEEEVSRDMEVSSTSWGMRQKRGSARTALDILVDVALGLGGRKKKNFWACHGMYLRRSSVWTRRKFVRKSYYDEDGDQGFKLVVDIPQLDCLSLIDSVSENFFLRNLNSLSKASIILGPTSIMANSSDGDGPRVYNLLSGIRNVKFLNMHFSFESDTNGYLLPTFHNLTELTFGGRWNLKLLADLLLCSPNLEVLILEVLCRL
ncbi:hypothetical protein Vadar_029031 [Vaccinium darrowii]|uniref:Uncharacterized protein n=1 Tax=Vaccinium darrowii TaxID=229202 RepID=A0ACB7Z7D1_9ERIC|nr:hypothetical protein Vadar_029031 [Vaccinium darrowii]